MDPRRAHVVVLASGGHQDMVVLLAANFCEIRGRISRRFIPLPG